jgi:hypothetical protein
VSKVMIVAAAMIVSLTVAAPARSQVSVSVNIGHPPPLVVAPPPLVVVPNSPVYYAPDYEYNLFFYRGRYYTQFNGGWFFAPKIGAGWVAVSEVPPPLRAVPVEYYRVKPGHGRGPGHCPPGQAKKGRC